MPLQPAPVDKTFRRDINALRAIAVMLVVFYHFTLFGVTGGFIGVDVFFVISGFLMTGLILQSGGKPFSLSGFYAARAKRIVPALAVLCLALLIGGWFWLAPADYKMLGTHAAGSISFISNFIYKGEDGYFDSPSKYKWLIHTWSLSVEWQFYLLYPLIIVFLRRKFPQRTLHLSLWALAAASLAASLILTPAKATVAFYLLPARMWEMLAGAFIYIYIPRGFSLNVRQRQWCEIAGIAIIVAASCLFSEDSLWPYWGALFPVIGAALVLGAARQDSIMAGNNALQALGRWSYSIYLWHWPMVVGIGYFFASDNNILRIAAVFVSIVLGAISYRFVEQPSRRWLSGAPPRVLVKSFIMGFAVLTLGLAIVLGGGFKFRVPDAVLVAEHGAETAHPKEKAADGGPCGFTRSNQHLTPCVLGNANNIRYVVWGDSHAGAIAGAVQQAAGDKAGILYFTHQCATIFNTELTAKGAGNHCPEFNNQVLQIVRGLPANVSVVIANRYSANIHGPNESVHKNFGIAYLDEKDSTRSLFDLYKEHLPQSLCEIAKGRRVFAVDPMPEIGTDVPRALARRAMLGRSVEDITLPRSDYDSRNAIAREALSIAASRCGITLIDPVPVLCNKDVCHGSLNGTPLYADDDHINDAGRALLLPLFKSVLNAK
ncbi:MAG: acyltransferase family protein [Micavibrio sp.]|nr:acyltransferase family protein [Micavibrio sp.]